MPTISYIIKYAVTFVGKMCESRIGKDSYIFSTNITAYLYNILRLKFNETYTNDVVNFEQPAPGSQAIIRQDNMSV